MQRLLDRLTGISKTALAIIGALALFIAVVNPLRERVPWWGIILGAIALLGIAALLTKEEVVVAEKTPRELVNELYGLINAGRAFSSHNVSEENRSKYVPWVDETAVWLDQNSDGLTRDSFIFARPPMNELTQFIGPDGVGYIPMEAKIHLQLNILHDELQRLRGR